ncbi:hypothetical protein LUZ60_013936 [Juncus effusus]|nr:hypothetical protein LUZ60_013936 [Juncus effusus]
MKSVYLLIGALFCSIVLKIRTECLEFTRSDFPSDFVFGAATSAYQVEGAAAEDGRTPTIWDTYVHSGLMPDNSTGDVAADGYHKYKEDVKLMFDTGLEAYRFSISWSRLIPYGRGEVNPKGLQYYNNLIDELVKYGIEIHVMLYQLDLPQALEDEYQGWLSPQIIDDFTSYANVCFKYFGDRVKHWTTIAEPNIIGLAGYDTGIWPPSRCSNPFGGINCTVGNSTTEPYIAVHNFVLSHASVYNLYRQKYYAEQKGLVGINVYSFWVYPFTDSNADEQAVRRYLKFLIGWIMDPLTFGDYPQIMKEIAGLRIPKFSEIQSEKLKGCFDFIGLNHYTSIYVSDDSTNINTGLRDYNADSLVKFSPSKNITPGSGYVPNLNEVVPDPDGLKNMLEYLKETYDNPPIYIQENGLALARKDSFEDSKRIDYISGFISSTLNYIRNGGDIKGYFIWSFVDLFEYLEGYGTTFGLYYVDFEHEEKTRIPRLSAHWYSNFIRNNGTISIGTCQKLIYEA